MLRMIQRSSAQRKRLASGLIRWCRSRFGTGRRSRSVADRSVAMVHAAVSSSDGVDDLAGRRSVRPGAGRRGSPPPGRGRSCGRPGRGAGMGGTAARLERRVGHRAPAEEGGHVVARPPRLRPRAAVAGQRGVHDPGVDGEQAVGVEAVALLAVGEEVGQEDLAGRRRGGAPARRPPAGRRPPRSTACPGCRPGTTGRRRAAGSRRASFGWREIVAHRIAPGRLDLDDVGAEIGQDRAGRGSRHPAGQLEHRHTVEGSRHGARR